MPRKNLIRQDLYPYHVFSRSNNKDWFQIPLSLMWEICLSCLEYAQNREEAQLHCFVLMSNHYHLLLTTPQMNLDRFMQAFNRQLSKFINLQSGVINHKFANRYKWTIVSDQNYLHNIYRYIYQNPVRANLSNKCVDYPYSSLQLSRSQIHKLKFKIHLDYRKYKNWFERYYGSDFDNVIRKGLKKAKFKVSCDERKYFQFQLDSTPF